MRRLASIAKPELDCENSRDMAISLADLLPSLAVLALYYTEVDRQKDEQFWTIVGNLEPAGGSYIFLELIAESGPQNRALWGTNAILTFPIRNKRTTSLNTVTLRRSLT